jgi:hypothetical protein
MSVRLRLLKCGAGDSKSMNTSDSRFEPIHDQFQPVGVETIRELEAKLNTSLPKAYINFLSRYGGCGFSGDANVRCGGSQLPIFTFFGGEKLLSNLRIYDDLAAERKFSFADDMFGNPYVLDASTGLLFFIDFTVNPPVGGEGGWIV